MKKVILAFILGLSLSAIGVVAISLCNAKDIEYKPSDTTWDIDTVEDALNDLYKVKGSNTNDSCNNVAKPKIDTEGKLIPIILSDDGKTTVVSKNDANWYNYCEKKWANAIILKDNVDPQKYPVGYQFGEDDEDDIESYFVWIPKYKYKLWNVNVNGINSTGALKQRHTIDVVFDTTNTIEENGVSCVTPMESGNIGECSNGEYMTHPAFISFGVDGFWVGKFETGHKNAANAAQAQVSSNDSSLIVVKPNVYSWRYNTVGNMFEAAYNYERDLDSHLMKNTEWGAVAYLSHSIYGINNEVNINNNSSFKTGYSAIPDNYQGTYPGISGDGSKYNTEWNTENGFLASTTGNITGVYDMSGGAWEYMASYRSGTYGSSGFNNATLEKKYDADYYDLYNSSSAITTNQYMILGDATGEIGPFKLFKDSDNGERYHNSWYGDDSYFVELANPWFRRSGSYIAGVLAGQFCFLDCTGGVDIYSGSRLVLAGVNKHPTT